MTANRFVWYELVTSDGDAALAFYGRLLGWEAQNFPGDAGRGTSRMSAAWRSSSICRAPALR